MQAAGYVILAACLGLSLGLLFAFLLRIPAIVRRSSLRAISDEIRG